MASVDISVSGMDEFLVTAGKAGWTSQDFDTLAKSEKKSRELLSVLRGTLMTTTPTLYTIKRGDGRTAKQLLAAGNYDTVWEGARTYVESKSFQLSETEEEVDFEMVEFGYDPTTEQVLAEFAKRGLERPLVEDALRFGEKFPDLQRTRPIVFVHEPWRGSVGDLHVLCLDGWDGKRSLRGNLFELRWTQQCLFPGRRPRK